MQYLHRCAFIIWLFFIVTVTYGFDNEHFYRASFFWGEPRFARDTLTTIDIDIGAGSTRTGRNICGNKTNILDIYGLYNVRLLGAGIPNLNPANPVEALLITLANLPSNDTFGFLSFNGKFKMVECDVAVTANFTTNFFMQFYLPIRSLELSNISYTDLSPRDSGSSSNISNPVWQELLTSFEDVLHHFDLSLAPVKKRGIGDISLVAGYTYSYMETNDLDYVDFSITTGILTPCAPQSCSRSVFDIPLGYNGHIGIPLTVAFSCGAFEWLTIGTNIGGIFFVSNTQQLQVKTDSAQQGMIFLGRTCARVHQGPIAHASVYLKADHLARGWSLLCGYNYAHKGHDHIYPLNSTFNSSIINSDLRFAGWSMHTIQLETEYDFSKEEHRAGVRISAFYNCPVMGKLIYNTGIGGGSCGLDILWRF